MYADLHNSLIKAFLRELQVATWLFSFRFQPNKTIYIYIYNFEIIHLQFRNYSPPDDSYTDETDCCGFLR